MKETATAKSHVQLTFKWPNLKATTYGSQLRDKIRSLVITYKDSIQGSIHAKTLSETARARLSQLASCMPGEYFVFDPQTHQIVAGLVRLASREQT